MAKILPVEFAKSLPTKSAIRHLWKSGYNSNHYLLPGGITLAVLVRAFDLSGMRVLIGGNHRDGYDIEEIPLQQRVIDVTGYHQPLRYCSKSSRALVKKFFSNAREIDKLLTIEETLTFLLMLLLETNTLLPGLEEDRLYDFLCRNTFAWKGELSIKKKMAAVYCRETNANWCSICVVTLLDNNTQVGRCIAMPQN